MSSSALRDKITVIFSNIVQQSKDPKLILLDLQDLLLQLKNISVFDGLQLFIDVIESKEPFEGAQIKEFLTIHLEDIAMFPYVYDFIKSQNIQIQDSIKLKETKEYPKDDFLKDITSSYSESKVTLDDFMRAESKTDKKPITSDSGSGPGSFPSPPPPPRSPSMAVPSPKPMLDKDKMSMSSQLLKEESKSKRQKPLRIESNKPSVLPFIDDKKELSRLSSKENLSDESKRNILIDYYSRMNINQIYDFNIKIDKSLLQAKKKQSDFLTGEQREQVTDEISVADDIPIEVELNLPGCLVSPSVQYVSPTAESSIVTFYVTPYVKFSKREAKIVIGQKKLSKKVISVQISVIDRRIMKIFSILGVLIASVPSLWQYLFGLNMNEQIYYSTVHYIPMITSTVIIPLEIATGGLITLISLLSFKRYSSKRSSFMSQQAF